MSSFTPAGSGGAPQTLTVPKASSPTVVLVNMPLANTEYTYTLPAGCKQFLLRLQGMNTLNVGYVSGSTNLTIPRGCFYQESDLNLPATLDIYLTSSSPSQVVELLVWT